MRYHLTKRELIYIRKNNEDLMEFPIIRLSVPDEIRTKSIRVCLAAGQFDILAIMVQECGARVIPSLIGPSKYSIS